MIAALSYFGVLSPSRFLPERCLIQSEFRCDDRQLQLGPNPGELTINVLLTNQLGNTITVDQTTADATYAQVSAGAGGCTTTPASPASVGSGQQFTLSCVIDNSGAGGFPAAGEKIKIPFSFDYQELGGAYPRSVTGEVAATIQP
jgi:hypothetical protein